MKSISCFILLGLVFPLLCVAQQDNYKDSLAHILTLNTSDSLKARAAFLLSDEWSYTDTVKAKHYLDQGIKRSGNNKYLHALSLFYSGLFLFETDMLKAEKLFLQSDSLLSPFATSDAYYFRSRCWRNYGALRQNVGDSKTMLAVLVDKAIPFAIKSGNKSYLGANYADVGLIFMNRWQYDKAESYYNKAIAILKQTGERRSANFDIYINAIRNLLYMSKLTEAKKMLDNIRSMIEPGTIREINFQLNEGIYFIEARQYQNALNVLDKALKLANKIGSAYSSENVMFQQYKAYEGLGRYAKAKDVLLYIIKNPSLNYSQNRLTEYFELAGIYARLGNMKSAYNWQKEYSTLLDSTNKSQLINEMNLLEIKFRNAENQKEITTLNAANEKAKLVAKNSRLISWLLGSASLFLLVVLVLGYFFYRNNKRSTAQKEQIKITQAMLQGQEDERNRVARDLHDGLGGMLAGVKINLSGLETNTASREMDSELQKIIGQLDNSVTELRRIAHNMMPEMLLKLGLEASLRDLCESLITKTLAVDFQSFGIKKTISVQEQITIYRIVQELFTNVLKHADAQNVLLQCSQNDNVFFITIEDDGKGFDASPYGDKKGIGLGNIKSRVAYLNGKIEILSKENRQGTSINIELHVTA